jgi:hypothetical protein
MKRFALLAVIAAVLAVQVQAASSSTTYVVGTCLHGSPSYATISEAVGAVPSGSTVLVCPGNYPEQPIITQPLTLKGIVIGNAGAAVIVPPSGGAVTNTDRCGQLTVQNTGSVEISHIVVDGSGNTGGCNLVGIYFQNASGTADEDVVRNQTGTGFGFGIFTDSMGSPETVNIQNSIIQNFDWEGIGVEDFTNTLTLNITGNTITAPKSSVDSQLPFAGIEYNGGTGTATRNFINVLGIRGILLHSGSAASPITGNTIVGSSFGIVGNRSPTVTSNKFLDISGEAIALDAGVIIQDNEITAVNVGIDLSCTTQTVSKNTINGASTGIANVPGGLATPNNSFTNTGALRSDCP